MGIHSDGKSNTNYISPKLFTFYNLIFNLTFYTFNVWYFPKTLYKDIWIEKYYTTFDVK